MDPDTPLHCCHFLSLKIQAGTLSSQTEGPSPLFAMCFLPGFSLPCQLSSHILKDVFLALSEKENFPGQTRRDPSPLDERPRTTKQRDQFYKNSNSCYLLSIEHLIHSIPYEPGTIIPILQMRKLKLIQVQLRARQVQAYLRDIAAWLQTTAIKRALQ